VFRVDHELGGALRHLPVYRLRSSPSCRCSPQVRSGTTCSPRFR
jgi:hypothetical protein